MSRRSTTEALRDAAYAAVMALLFTPPVFCLLLLGGWVLAVLFEIFTALF